MWSAKGVNMVRARRHSLLARGKLALADMMIGAYLVGRQIPPGCGKHAVRSVPDESIPRATQSPDE